MTPHFEEANGRRVLYVDGKPFTVLAVEIPWWDLIYARYKETQTAYDALYAAAEQIGLNALKVPIKWSMVEPEKGVYDFSYVDHAKTMAEKHHLRLVLN
jgi:beta-galactosidase GanA